MLSGDPRFPLPRRSPQRYVSADRGVLPLVRCGVAVLAKGTRRHVLPLVAAASPTNTEAR